MAATSKVELQNPSEAPEPGPVTRSSRDYGAWIFMITVTVSLIAIAMLAQNIFAAAHNLEAAKRHAEVL